MPAMMGRARIGIGAGLRKAAAEEIDWGQEFTKLPGGISGGVAQLTEAKTGVYKSGPNEGKPFVYLGGTVIEPATATETIKIWDDAANGGKGTVKIVGAKMVKVAGLQTGLTLPLCDTKKSDGKGGTVIVSLAEHAETLGNELKKLANDPHFLDGFGQIPEGDDKAEQAHLQELLAWLKESAPYFRFSTSQGNPSKQYPEARVWENWYGSRDLANYVPPETSSVVDNTAPKANEQPAAHTVPPVKEEPAAPAFNEFAAPPVEEPQAAPPSTEQDDDLDALVTAADANDMAAQDRLGELAREAGIDEEWLTSDESTWPLVGEKILEAWTAEAGERQATEEPEPEPAPPPPPANKPAPAKPAQKPSPVAAAPAKPAAPKKGSVMTYRAINPQTKRPHKVEVIVEAVDARAKTADLLNNDNKKTRYKNVPWEKLATN